MKTAHICCTHFSLWFQSSPYFVVFHMFSSPWLSATVSKFKEKSGDLGRVVSHAARDVAQLTREVALDVAAPFRNTHSSLQFGSIKDAEDLTHCLEKDAMRVGLCTEAGASMNMSSAAELLGRWAELVRSDDGQTKFTDTTAAASSSSISSALASHVEQEQQLTFRQVLLRSRAVELVVAGVASNPRLRAMVSAKGLSPRQGEDGDDQR